MRYLFIILFLFSGTIYGQSIAPIPPSGTKEFVNYINNNLTLTKEAIANRLYGELEIEFRVNEEGILDSFNIVKDIGENSALELIKVVKSAGDWSPAFNDGVQVAHWVSLPYTILQTGQLQDNKSIIPASPIDGFEAFRVKFFNNFKYPTEAINAGVKGDFTLSFEVKEDGSLTAIKLLKNPGYGVEESAIRALKRAGKWSPAVHDGKAMKSVMTFNFNLSLKEFRRHI